MKFVVSEWDGTLTRTNVADALTAISPADNPTSDYQRGYVDALIRVGLVFGVELVEQPSAGVLAVAHSAGADVRVPKHRPRTTLLLRR